MENLNDGSWVNWALVIMVPVLFAIGYSEYRAFMARQTTKPKN